MPTTYWTYLIGALALAGIPPLAGFWSKDEILADAFGHGHYIVWLVLTVAAFLTAFYMTRQVVVVFLGNFRGYSPRVATHPSEPKAVEHPHEHGDEHAGAHEHGGHDPHESPWTMWLPLAILAVFAALAGFVNVTGGLSGFFGQEAEGFNFVTAGIATVLAVAGIGLGWVLYRDAFASAADLDPLERMMPGVFRVLNRKFYFDEIYGSTFGKLSYGLAWAWNLFDRYVLDGILRLTAAITVFFGRLNFVIDDTVLNDGADALTDGTYNTGDAVRQAETGKIQDYASLIFAGVVVLGLIYLYSLGK
jgi:NADH-quinone oxidoreductase subunit L